MTPDQQALVKCLRAGHRGCPVSLRAAAQAAASQLSFAKVLGTPPKCFTCALPPCPYFAGNRLDHHQCKAAQSKGQTDGSGG